MPTRREFISGERIVDQGVRVTEQQALFLEQLESLILLAGRRRGVRRPLDARAVGRSLLVVLTLGLFGWLARVHVPADLRRPRLLVTQTVIMAVFLGGAAIALDRPALGHLAVPIVLLSLLSTVLAQGAGRLHDHPAGGVPAGGAAGGGGRSTSSPGSSSGW